MTVISHSNKFIFLHPKKCAGDSITEPLLEYNDVFKLDRRNNMFVSDPVFYKSRGGVREVKNLTITDLIDDNKLDVDDYKDYYIFSVVRNPWDRFVSFISSKSKMEAFTRNGKIIDTIERRNLTRPIPVSDFITYSGDKVENRELDYIIRFEDLQNGFDKVCEDLDIPYVNLNHLNKSNLRDGKDYKEYYTEASKEYIYNKYREDIDRFEYEFGD